MKNNCKDIKFSIVNLFNILYNKVNYVLINGSALLENIAYLDNSSTTRPCPSSVEAVCEALNNNWGNPSSLHILGVNSELAVTDVREAVARSIGATSQEIYFTAGGTEGDNIAILGAARALKKRGKRIVTTQIEHHAVLETVKMLEEEGFEVVYLKPDKWGFISEDDVRSAVTADTALVSMMLVNNEVGSVLPVRSAADAIKAVGAPAYLHCDAVQGYGKLEIDVKKLGVDLLTVSGHKVHAPKGVGALYVRKGVNIKPIIAGGGQEKGLRSGTEAVPAICGFGAAVSEMTDIKGNLQKIAQLRDYTAKRLRDELGCVINSHENALPYVLNASLVGFRSETLLHFLEAKGVFVSSGSACAKGQGSYVLLSMGLPRSRVDSAIRISFSKYSTKEEADRLVEALKDAATRLKGVK